AAERDAVERQRVSVSAGRLLPHPPLPLNSDVGHLQKERDERARVWGIRRHGSRIRQASSGALSQSCLLEAKSENGVLKNQPLAQITLRVFGDLRQSQAAAHPWSARACLSP